MRRFSKFILKILPDWYLVNWLVVFAQSLIFHKNPFVIMSKSLNGYILREKIVSSGKANYVDKIEAKKYLEEKGAPFPKTLRIVEVIEKDQLLPAPWIFKSSHDCSGGVIFTGNELIDVKGKVLDEVIKTPSSDEVLQVLLKFTHYAQSKNLFYETREQVYNNIKPRFFFEELLVVDGGGAFEEAKFHMVKGELAFSYLVLDRLGDNKRAIVDSEFNLTAYSWCKPRDLHKYKGVRLPQKPKLWEEMKIAAKDLAEKFEYVRIDIFYSDSEFYIGELTFFHGSGLELLLPRSVDYSWGISLR